MSASATAAAPSSLLRRPLPAAHSPAARRMQVDVTGELVADAEMRMEPATGCSVITLRIGQGSGEPTVRAVQWYGQGPDCAIEAEARAHAMPAGQRVRVMGEGLAFRWEHGSLVFAFGYVRSVELLEAAQ